MAASGQLSSPQTSLGNDQSDANIRLDSAVLSNQAANGNQRFWSAFESDAECLELRLGQMLRHRNNQSKILKTFVQNLKASQ
ncbi:hypothetical protein SCAR479_01831 [Seiridium cardinale]|uniref:Uncharacterized protein n=1 Tax=Seiridium cardinale TaxID=138064 RepID=A0ABR2Y6J9_9PEZI